MHINPTPADFAFALLIAVAILVLPLCRPLTQWKLAAGAMLALFLWNLTFPGHLQLTSRNVLTSDPFFATLLAIAIWRLLRGFLSRPYSIILLALALLAGVSLARGFHTFGLTTGMAGDFRYFFNFLSSALFAASFPLSARYFRPIAKMVLGTVVFMLLIVAWRWAALLGGIYIPEVMMRVGIATPLRVIDSDQALFLVQAFFIILFLSSSRLTLVPLAAITGIVIVVLQHKTDWSITAAGLFIYLLCDRQLRGRVMLFAGKTVVIAGLVILASSSLATLVMQHITNSTEALEHRRSSTFVWRVTGWNSLLEDFINADAGSQVIGLPFGSGYARSIDNSVVDAHPHNFYVQTLLRTGVAGLLLFLLFYWALGSRLVREGLSGSVLSSAEFALWSVLFMSQLLYYLTYPPSPEQGTVVGCIVAMLVQKRARPRSQVPYLRPVEPPLFPAEERPRVAPAARAVTHSPVTVDDSPQD
jgi:hypothetical protein